MLQQAENNQDKQKTFDLSSTAQIQDYIFPSCVLCVYVIFVTNER